MAENEYQTKLNRDAGMTEYDATVAGMAGDSPKKKKGKGGKKKKKLKQGQEKGKKLKQGQEKGKKLKEESQGHFMAHNNEYDMKNMRDGGYSERDAVLKSMKRSKKAMKKESAPPAVMTEDEYPYGLKLELNSEVLDMLGIKMLKDVGDYCKIDAVGMVESVEQRSTKSGKKRSMSVQITKMHLSPYEMMDEKVTKGDKDYDKEYKEDM